MFFLAKKSIYSHTENNTSLHRVTNCAYFCSAFFNIEGDFMLYQIYSVLNGVVAVITFVFGILLFFVLVPNRGVFHNYRICRKLLAIAYLIMAGLNTVELFMSDGGSDPFITHYITLIVSSFQAFLFTYALITLINTEFLTLRRFIKELTPITILTVFCTISLVINLPNQIQFVIFYLGIAYYGFQLIKYTLLYNRQFDMYQEKLNNFFSEKESIRLRWTRFAFYIALSAGIMALTSEFLNSTFSAVIFILFFAFFYLYFGIKYLNHVFVFNTIEPVIHPGPEVKIEVLRLSNEDIAPAVDNWVKNKGFVKTGITLIDLAVTLNTNRTYLSTYINQQKGMNFNAWINWLRIEEAKAILSEYPKIPIAEVSEQLGYSEQSNFSRYFLKYTGTTPSSWRKEGSLSLQ